MGLRKHINTDSRQQEITDQFQSFRPCTVHAPFTLDKKRTPQIQI